MAELTTQAWQTAALHIYVSESNILGSIDYLSDIENLGYVWRLQFQIHKKVFLLFTSI